jgi:predicted RecA/RadA family phage recombinase
VKNYISKGEVLELTAPSGGVVAGSAYLIGGLLVVATVTAAEGAKFNAIAEGIVDLPKAVEDALTEGGKVYWDNSAKKITTVSGGNTLVGVAVLPIVPFTVALATNALAADLAISGLTLTVLDFAQLNTDNATVTVTINGVETVLTEDVEWDAATSNDATATALAAAINALTGVKATATTNVVTVVPATGLVAGDASKGRVRLDGVAR